MSSSQNIDFHLKGKLKKLKHVPKEYLQTTKIMVSGTDSFMHVTFWIPKADLKYNRPRLALSMSIGEDKLGVYFDTIIDFQRFMDALGAVFNDRLVGITAALNKAQSEYDFFQTEYNKMREQFR